MRVKGVIPKKNFQDVWVDLCFERQCPKQNTFARLRQNFGPKKILGWLRYWAEEDEALKPRS